MTIPPPSRRAFLSGAAAALAWPLSLAAQPASEPLARIALAVPGVTLEVVSVTRLTAHPVVEVRFNLVNGGSQRASLNDLGMGTGHVGVIGSLTLLDLANGMAYGIARTNGRNLTGVLPHPRDTIGAGERRDGLWAWFGAPPAAVTRVTLEAPGGAPAVDLPLVAR